MSSSYISKLNQAEKDVLLQELHDRQSGECFICGKIIDISLHKNSIDIDHVIPSSLNGADNPGNFALTHSSCNRAKQDSNLNIARVISKFDTINESIEKEGRAANLGDILNTYRRKNFPFKAIIHPQIIEYALADVGKNDIYTLPLYEDEISGFKYFFAQLPIEYIEHDSKLNPRAIGSNIKKLIKEFHTKRPQLHVALGWLNTEEGNNACIRIFDGQHKAAAQIMLGAKMLPVRVFVNPDVDTLLTANTLAGTTLRQVAFELDP